MKRITFLFLSLAFGLQLISAQNNIGQKIYTSAEVKFNQTNPNCLVDTTVSLKTIYGSVVSQHFNAAGEFDGATETFNTSCGLNNGKMIGWAAGGLPPYRFKFTDNQTKKVILDTVSYSSSVEKNGLGPGTYRNDIYDSGSAHYSLWFAQIDPSTAPVASLVATKETCGKKDATVNATVTGGKTQGMFFDWVGPNGFKSKFQNISGLSSGPYTVTVTDGDWCTDVKSVQVTCIGNAILYSSIITIKVCDSTKTFKLDTVDSKMKSTSGLDSFTIFKYVFDGKPFYGTRDSIICGPEIMFGQTRSIIAPKTLHGCDSFTVVHYKSGIDTMRIQKMSCSLDTTLLIVIHRVNKCDSIVFVTYFPAPAPFIDIVEKVSCVKTGFDTIHHYFNGLPCLRDSFMEVIKYLPVKVDTITTSLKTCDQNSAQALFTEKVQKNSDSCIIKVFLKEVLWTGLIPRNITVNKDTCDAKLKKLVIKDTIPSLLEGKCDSIYLDYIYSVHKPFLKDSLIRVCSQSEVKPEISVKDFTYYGCDSIVTIKYVYTAPILVPLGDSTICGTKNSTNLLVKSLAFTGSTCDSAVLTQRVIAYESPKIQIDKIVYPIKNDGIIDLSVVGGTGPYDWTNEKGEPISPEMYNLSGGVYTFIVTDKNGCSDIVVITLPNLAVVNEGGELFLIGIITPDVAKTIGAFHAKCEAFNTCGKSVLNLGVVDFTNPVHIRLDLSEAEFSAMRIEFSKALFVKKVFKI